MRPACIPATRVANCATTGKLCEIRISVNENSRWSRASNSRICAPTETSSAETGSSAISNSGRRNKARAEAERQRGTKKQGARDADAVALPAGKFVRVAIERLGTQSHGGENFGCSGAALRTGKLRFVNRQRLADDSAHAQPWV